MICNRVTVNRKPKLRIEPIADQNGQTRQEADMGDRSLRQDDFNSIENEASMIARHQSNPCWITAPRPAQLPQLNGDADLRRSEDTRETNSWSNQTHPDWTLIATVIFVVLVWSALFFCMYYIWAKSRGTPTF